MRMVKEQWAEFAPYFTYEECGDMDYDFMKKVLTLRLRINLPMHVIDGATTSGHAKDSYHYKARALDFWCPCCPRIIQSIIDYTGLFAGSGFYPWGAHDSFHIDDRPFSDYQRWVSPEKGKYIYLLKDRGVNY